MAGRQCVLIGIVAAAKTGARQDRLQDQHPVAGGATSVVEIGLRRSDHHRGVGRTSRRRAGAGLLLGRTVAAPILLDAFARTGKIPAALPKPPKVVLLATNAKLPLLPLRRFCAVGELVRTGGRPGAAHPVSAERVADRRRARGRWSGRRDAGEQVAGGVPSPTMMINGIVVGVIDSAAGGWSTPPGPVFALAEQRSILPGRRDGQDPAAVGGKSPWLPGTAGCLHLRFPSYAKWMAETAHIRRFGAGQQPVKCKKHSSAAGRRVRFSPPPVTSMPSCFCLLCSIVAFPARFLRIFRRSIGMIARACTGDRARCRKRRRSPISGSRTTSATQEAGRHLLVAGRRGRCLLVDCLSLARAADLDSTGSFPDRLLYSAVLLTYWTALGFVTRRGGAGRTDDGQLHLLVAEVRLAKTDAMLLLHRRWPRWARWARVYLSWQRGEEPARPPWTSPAIFWTALAGGILLKGR